jgi:glycosyltransferase involved in cell wall biosynthesis
MVFMSYSATIVVPLRRQVDEWLDESVRSALLQSVPTEVIVVRSEMTPASNLGILSSLRKHFDNLAVLDRDKPESFPGAINKGIRHSSSERVGLLLSDDWLDERAVGECLRNDTDIVCTGRVVYLPDGSINERACWHPSLQEFNSIATLEERASYLGHFLLLRRQTVLDAGGLDESIGNYPGIDDFDLIWTLLERNASVSVVAEGLYHYRDHDGERLTLQDPALQLANLKKILRKHGVTDEQAVDIVKRHARWYGKPMYQVTNES